MLNSILLTHKVERAFLERYGDVPQRRFCNLFVTWFGRLDADLYNSFLGDGVCLLACIAKHTLCSKYIPFSLYSLKRISLRLCSPKSIPFHCTLKVPRY